MDPSRPGYPCISEYRFFDFADCVHPDDPESLTTTILYQTASSEQKIWLESVREERRKEVKSLKEVMATFLDSAEVSTPSRIFNPLTTLGHVSNHVPCLVRLIHTRRKVLIVTCTGREFNTYDGSGLKLISTSGVHPYQIGCMASDNYHVYTAVGNIIYAWRRGNELQHVYTGHDSDIIQLLSFGHEIISLHADGSIIIWDVKNETRTTQPAFHIEGKPAVMCHPPTYINKIVVGSDTGSMVILNTKSGQLIFKFASFNAKILQIIESPAVDVVAIALEDNRIIIHNMKIDRTLMKFATMDTPISLAFRRDGFPVLLCGSKQGSVTAWNLETKLKIAHKENVHRGPVTGLMVIPSEPFFITSSSDNSLLVWTFDMPDGSFRLYNKREGHSGPSNRVRFFGKSNPNVKIILSAGSDGSFRQFHLFNETYNRTISPDVNQVFPSHWQRSMLVDFTAEGIVNPSHHADIAARHAGQVGLSIWSISSMEQGRKLIIHPRYKHQPDIKIECTCLVLTSCSQFVVAGYDDGSVERFNIQSGRHRRTYGKPPVPAHSGTVRGVACDQIKENVLSGGSDNCLQFWKFDTGVFEWKIELESGVSFMIHQNTNFVGVSLDNFDIYVVDFLGRQIFRKFVVSSSPLLDACFSPDNVWLTASAADGCVRTWDLITGSLVDVFRHQSLITSLEYSPSGEHLIGSMHDDVGILVWKNKTLYEAVSLMPMKDDYMPPTLGVVAPLDEAVKSLKDRHDDLKFQSAEQIESNLLTLSLLPASRWKNLLELDAIRKRNKATEPAKTYVAPFFLTDKVVATTNEPMDVETSNTSLNPQNVKADEGELPAKTFRLDRSPFQRALMGSSSPLTRVEVVKLLSILHDMGPSRVSAEIQSLGPNDGGSIELLRLFILFSANFAQNKICFEVGQAYLGLFLKTHAATIYVTESLMDQLTILEPYIPAKELGGMLTNIKGCVNFIKSKLF